ncbi:MAG TPA: hypothetical protein VG937_16590 [Polyangiaceae bacterium]|nr:hypothetical protein [Polyangiaceae bacterium]
MYRLSVFHAGFLMLLLTWFCACSSAREVSARDAADANDTGRVLEAKGASERAVLARLSTFPTGTPQRVGEITVSAGAPYPAASGRTCRSLQVSLGNAVARQERLACTDGRSWFFVPDVFARGKAE